MPSAIRISHRVPVQICARRSLILGGSVVSFPHVPLSYLMRFRVIHRFLYLYGEPVLPKERRFMFLLTRNRVPVDLYMYGGTLFLLCDLQVSLLRLWPCDFTLAVSTRS